MSGFCCSQPQLVPREVWRRIITAVAQSRPRYPLRGLDPGPELVRLRALQGIGFDGAFSSAPWWDGRANWFIEEHELLRGLGAVIASPEAPFGPRLARRLGQVENPVPLYRHMLQRAAAIGDGIVVPMGFEYAAADDMDARQESSADSLSARPGSNADLSEEIREANALSAELKALKINREMRRLTDPAQGRYCSYPLRQIKRPGRLRADRRGDQHRSPAREASADCAQNHFRPRLAQVSRWQRPSWRNATGARHWRRAKFASCRRAELIQSKPRDPTPRRRHSRRRRVSSSTSWSPSVDGGRFAAKRVIGEPLIVEADVFTDGHETLGVELLWRSANRKDWSRLPMQHLNNDRWRATIHPERIGRYELTVEAWIEQVRNARARH